VKPYVTNVGSSSERHAEGLNSPIEVHVIKRILIVPDSHRWIGHFVTHEPKTVVSRVRLYLIYYRARRCPSHDRRLHPDRGGNW